MSGYRTAMVEVQSCRYGRGTELRTGQCITCVHAWYLVPGNDDWAPYHVTLYILRYGTAAVKPSPSASSFIPGFRGFAAQMADSVALDPKQSK